VRRKNAAKEKDRIDRLLGSNDKKIEMTHKEHKGDLIITENYAKYKVLGNKKGKVTK
jgi:hypothetical protein